MLEDFGNRGTNWEKKTKTLFVEFQVFIISVKNK